MLNQGRVLRQSALQRACVLSRTLLCLCAILCAQVQSHWFECCIQKGAASRHKLQRRLCFLGQPWLVLLADQPCLTLITSKLAAS